MENVEPAICELGLKIPLLVSHDELRTAQKFMARFVAGLLGGKYGHFEKFERVSGVDGNLHIYMLYTSDGRQIHTVAVLNGQTGEVVELHRVPFAGGNDDLLASGAKGPGESGRSLDGSSKPRKPDETQTQSEKEYAQAYFKQFGDINFIVSAIVGAVFFTLLVLTGNTMMQSVRERIPELAVLKTLGFTDGGIVALLLAESVVLCVSAAALGLLLATVLFPAIKDIAELTRLPGQVIAQGAVLAVILAVVTALPPAINAGRLKIVDALARR